MVAASEKFRLPRKPAFGAACEHAFIKRKPVMFDNEWLDADIFQRDLLSPGNRFEGPAIVHEYSATTVVPPGCRAAVDTFSNLLIEV
jgi:N-methylhydantoinase A